MLADQAPFDGGSAGAGGATRRWWWGECFAEKCCQPFAGISAVAALRAVLRSVDGEHGAVHPGGQGAKRPGTLRVAECRGGGQVERQLHPRVGGVDPLPTRSGRVRVALRQLCRRDHQPVRHPRTRRDAHLKHGSTVASRVVTGLASQRFRAGLACAWCGVCSSRCLVDLPRITLELHRVGDGPD